MNYRFPFILEMTAIELESELHNWDRGGKPDIFLVVYE